LLAPAIATVFLLGVFWKRTTAKGALWGMVIGFAIGMFRLALNVTIGAKAGLVMEAKKLVIRIGEATEYTKDLVITGLQDFSDKLGNILPAGSADAFQSPVKEALTSLSSLSPASREQASALITQVGGSLDQLFSGQYGWLFSIASVNSYVFTAFLFLFCIILVVVISLLTPKPTEKQLQYTVMAATAEQKAITRASWNKWDVIHTVIILGIVALF